MVAIQRVLDRTKKNRIHKGIKMLIEIKEIDYCRLNIKFEADPKQVEDKRTEVMQYFKKSPVPGFRTGKATADAISHHFKHKINEVMKSELAQSAFQQVVAEKNIRPFGQPQFLSLSLDGTKFKCDFCVNKVPEVELKEYKGFTLTKGNMPNAIEMAEKILQELRNRNGETIPFTENDFIQLGDTAIVNYTGRVEGKQDPVINVDGELYVVGKAALEVFNENVLGMKVGETREFSTTILEGASFIELVGKEVKFTVELTMASKSTPAPLDDALATKIGAKDVAEMVSLTQGMASKRVQELEKKHISEQISAQLVQNHEFEVPTWLSSFEAQALARQYGTNWDQLSDDDKSKFIVVAIKNVRLSIILDKIREVEIEAQLSDEEVIGLIKSNIRQYATLPGMEGKSDEEVLDTIHKSGYMAALVVSVRDDFTVDFISKSSSILE